MKILYSLTSYPPAIGGAQLHTHQVVKRLAASNSVQVITQWTQHRTDWLLGTTLNAPHELQAYEVDGVPVQPITLTHRERWHLAPYVMSYYLLKALAIDRISDVLAEKINEHAQNIELLHNARIGREALSYASLKVARRRDVPFVFVPYHHPRWVGWVYKEYIALYRQADAIIALTNAEKKKLIELGVPEERIFITGMGPTISATTDASRVCHKYALSNSAIVLFIGQQYQYKGVEALLHASKQVWLKFPETRFVFVGPRTRFSERLFAQVDDRRIIELGKVTLQEKSDLLAACTLLCVPSMQESFGGVYTEGWMMEKPVIGGDIPAIRDVISEGQDGYVVKQDAATIAERICYLLDNPTLATTMGAHGKKKVLERYTWDKLASKTRQVYQAVLTGQL